MYSVLSFQAIELVCQLFYSDFLVFDSGLKFSYLISVVLTLVVSASIWSDSFLISGVPSSSKRFSLISMVFTVVLVFLTILKIAWRVGSSSLAAMFVLAQDLSRSALSVIDVAPVRVLGIFRWVEGNP